MPADGVFGPTTEAKLRQFQRDHGLVPDGIAGPATWLAIDSPGQAAAANPSNASGGAPPAAGASGIITAKVLTAVAPGASQTLLQGLVAPMAAACARFGIDSPLRVAAFFSQCAHESGGFKRREEALSYSAERLMVVWPSRFPTLAAAKPFAKNPEGLANNVYASRMGNGKPASGDGFRFRGRGFKQLTGRNNYTAFAKAMSLSLDDVVEYTLTDEGACMSGGWFWAENKLNSLADARNIAKLTERINGGLIGLPERRALFAAACNALGID